MLCYLKKDIAVLFQKCVCQFNCPPWEFGNQLSWDDEAHHGLVFQVPLPCAAPTPTLSSRRTDLCLPRMFHVFCFLFLSCLHTHCSLCLFLCHPFSLILATTSSRAGAPLWYLMALTSSLFLLLWALLGYFPASSPRH